jgi:hypothetical protein
MTGARKGIRKRQATPATEEIPARFPSATRSPGRTRSDLRAHYESGATIRDLARRTGRSTSSIYDYLKRCGTTMPPYPFNRTT